MEALTFGAFIGRDVIGIDRDRSMFGAGIHELTIHQGERTFYGCSIRNRPLNTPFVDGIVRTFGLTGATINTFIGDLDSHDLKL
jgi:hypothetical protein